MIPGNPTYNSHWSFQSLYPEKLKLRFSWEKEPQRGWSLRFPEPVIRDHQTWIFQVNMERTAGQLLSLGVKVRFIVFSPKTIIQTTSWSGSEF